MQGPITVTELAVTPETVESGERVSIAATVANGGEANATRDLELVLFDEVVSVRTVSLSPGETSQVEFVRGIEPTGTYEAQVGSAIATVTVGDAGTRTATPAAASGPGFTAGGALLALIGLGLWARYRRQPRGRR